MSKGREFLGELVFNRTYAKTLNDGTKESWADCVSRNKEMYLKKFPHLAHRINWAYDYVENKLVLPSMRSLQFGGEAIERSPVRAYNCSFLAMDSTRAFSELFWILMNGAGVGYSVQARHINKLPRVGTGSQSHFVIEDTKESWADSIEALYYNPHITFDYSKIRPKDAPISTGGYASGPESLKETHEKVRKILVDCVQRSARLTSLEVHDICCILADVVVVGGVRRAALICLFDAWDQQMLYCKAGNWWETAPWRRCANNSAVILRDHPQSLFYYNAVMKACRESNSGEPGISWTNNPEWGYNPCHEIALRSQSFCNLTEVNAAKAQSKSEFFSAVNAANFIGCLQASLTDFPYLRPSWKQNCDADALLGVSLTGQAENWSRLASWLDDYSAAEAHLMTATNAAYVGLNMPARINCVKPSGTASSFLGTTAGIHAAHDDYYIRRIRIERIHPLAGYLQQRVGQFMEADQYSASNLVLSIPIAFEGAIKRDEESALELFDRAMHVTNTWVKAGHVYGDNTHNVSCTLTVKENEWEGLWERMWKSRHEYAGMAILPYDGGSYPQLPYESIDKETFTELDKKFDWESIDFSEVNYSSFKEDKKHELACSGAQGCDIV